MIYIYMELQSILNIYHPVPRMRSINLGQLEYTTKLFIAGLHASRTEERSKTVFIISTDSIGSIHIG